MASVIDTIRTALGSKHSVLKILTVSIILAYPLFQVYTSFPGWFATMSIVSYVAIVFALGFIILSCYNLINEKEILLPGFINPFKILFAGIGGVLALGPMIALMVYVGYCLNMIFVQKGLPMPATVAGVSVAEIILFGFLAVQITQYSRKLNPLAAYNLVRLLKYCADFALKAVFLLIAFGVISAITLFPLGFLAFQMFGPGMVFFFIMVAFAVLLILLITLYYSQLYMEIVMMSTTIDFTESTGDLRDKSLLIDQDKN